MSGDIWFGSSLVLMGSGRSGRSWFYSKKMVVVDLEELEDLRICDQGLDLWSGLGLLNERVWRH